ncbi:hypothetical protein BU23DRAFT_482729 [Bimuria novae-zelandiae CBS 107.79]|uniref:Stress-response A/B barrel domain-containing protein n=1 Tax=Bimuria novae-zelandiae CBS 107.79 TaxID=1447943 RepID=A0A6A5UR94_9PLEO|nr:hypothetical protein BU23DRAFT_482729 [Bimuria novae-zelandiae CBS 107.79]
MPAIIRLTLFKIPDPDLVQQAVQKYTTLNQVALKDGKPYIQISAGHTTHADPRSKGYTFVARTVFLSKEDMNYYDTEDEAHAEIKAMLKGKLEEGPPLVIIMGG